MDQPVAALIDMAQLCTKHEARQAVFQLWMLVQAKFADRPVDIRVLLDAVEKQGQPNNQEEEAEKLRKILEWAPEGV